MGWDFGYETMAELKARLKARALHHRTVGSHLWTIEDCHGTPTIVLYLLASNKGMVGYKDMTEAMEPYYYDCPPALLELAPATAPEWREKVLAYAEARAAARARRKALKCGDTIELPEGYTPRKLTITCTKPLRGEANGRTYRIGPRHIAAACSA